MPIKKTPPIKNEVILEKGSYIAVRTYKDVKNFDTKNNDVRYKRQKNYNVTYKKVVYLSLSPSTKKKNINFYALSFPICNIMSSYWRKGCGTHYEVRIENDRFLFDEGKDYNKTGFLNIFIFPENKKNYELLKEGAYYEVIKLSETLKNPRLKARNLEDIKAEKREKEKEEKRKIEEEERKIEEEERKIEEEERELERMKEEMKELDEKIKKDHETERKIKKFNVVFVFIAFSIFCAYKYVHRNTKEEPTKEKKVTKKLWK